MTDVTEETKKPWEVRAEEAHAKGIADLQSMIDFRNAETERLKRTEARDVEWHTMMREDIASRIAFNAEMAKRQEREVATLERIEKILTAWGQK